MFWLIRQILLVSKVGGFQDKYESAFELISENLKNAIDEEGVKELINILFPTYPYRISSYNVQEFFEIFGKHGIKTKEIGWADIRKVLREQKNQNTVGDSLLIYHGGHAFNPNAWIVRKWFLLSKLVALYYFISVPCRIAFIPWSSMTETGALGTDLTADIITAFNVLVLANTAYLSSRSAWVINRNKICRRINIGYIIAAFPLDW